MSDPSVCTALIERLSSAIALERAPLVAERMVADLADLHARGALELPEALCRPQPERYARRMLYRDPELRFTVVVVTWGPGQGTPIHDHAGLWGVEHVVEGELETEAFERLGSAGDGRLRLRSLGCARERGGDVAALLPPHDVHRMRNPSASRKAVTLHVYGGELVLCNVFAPVAEEVYEREVRSLWYAPWYAPPRPETPELPKARGFLVRQQQPLNAGPELERLGESAITPFEQFFVRNHGDVPAIDPPSHRILVTGEVMQPLELSLPELLERFARREVTATVQCAGNRREEMIACRPIPNELGWGSEAIGTATWAGVALADVLAAAVPTGRAAHVELIGADETERAGRRFRFGGSIPLAKALGPEVLLATEMNGAPLPALHGAPLRALVPGFIGARSVKWLREIRLLWAPSENYFQRRAYRLFGPGTDAENVVWDDGIMLGELPVVAIITRPATGAVLAAGEVEIAGIAYSGGGRTIERVDVASDGGRNWRHAELGETLGLWAWRRWSCRLQLPAGEHTIVARAWDSAAQTQPEHVEQVWNFKGYMNNAWPRITLRCR